MDADSNNYNVNNDLNITVDLAAFNIDGHA